MRLGLMLHDPEEEHDCFSDNTYNSHYYDGMGVRNVYLGRYVRIDGSVVEGPSVSELVAEVDPALDAELRAALDRTMAALGAIKTAGEAGTHYDQLLATGNAEGEALVMAADRCADRADPLDRARGLGARPRGDRLRGLRQPRQPGGGVPVGMRRLALAFALWPAAAIAGAAAGGLAVIPRTPEEAARVAAVTAPATDFSTPEPFEARPGGAATATKPPDANAFSHVERQHVVRARARLQGRQRPVPQALGDGAGLDPGVGRARAALQRARVPVLPPEGRPRAPADRAGRPGGRDVPAAVGAGGARRGGGDLRRHRGLPGDAAGADLWRAAAELRGAGAAGRGADAGELRGAAGDARRRRGGDAAPAELRGRRPRLRAAGAGRAALAAGGAADDRARAARGGAGGRHPGARRSRRRRRRRDQRAAEPRLVGGGRAADARALRAGRPGSRRSARRRPRRSPATSASRRRSSRRAGATAPRRRPTAGRSRMAASRRRTRRCSTS